MPESRKRFSTVFSSGWICILASRGRNEMLGGTEKLQRQRRLLSDDGLRFGLRSQSLFQNASEAVDVEQLEVESPSASRVQTSGAAAFAPAQQLPPLAQTTPADAAAQ